ncbi:elongation factor 1-beta [Methanoplanus endosymbiosus]|uniref:Elongation factor 1-beta n=1 Tax=Methanoplanus endosymbiosus TaxID=33865 RepID=A0A9E7PLS7_9EURY|nr:elongation factor 1-beta [Methanoplanus endosymbiosus]UUX91181.1 elongation factor 1-beta [Methanoplanus endosymbiosus]
MGDVAVIFKVMPESPDVDLEALKATIKETLPGTQDIQVEPIGFGLSALKMIIVVPDGEGTPEDAEASLKAIEGVESAEIESVTLT